MDIAKSMFILKNQTKLKTTYKFLKEVMIT